MYSLLTACVAPCVYCREGARFARGARPAPRAGTLRWCGGAPAVGAPPPPALRSFSLYESPASSRAATGGGDQTPSIVLTSPALERKSRWPPEQPAAR